MTEAVSPLCPRPPVDDALRKPQEAGWDGARMRPRWPSVTRVSEQRGGPNATATAEQQPRRRSSDMHRVNWQQLSAQCVEQAVKRSWSRGIVERDRAVN